jgi:upstream activation factor subunit UAF30
MSFNLESLELHIRDILASPGTDLSTISAKTVRLQLTDIIPWLTPEVAREKKKDIDEVITGVYQAICAEYAQDEEAASGEEAESTRKRNQGSDEENSGQDDEDEGSEAPRPVKRAKKEEEGDGKSKAKKGRGSANGTGKKVGRPRKSAATVDSGAESEGGSKKRTRKKSGAGEGGRARGGFAKEYILR